MNNTMIEFSCPECGREHQVPANYEGRKGRCSQCHTVVRVRDGVAGRYVSSAERQGVGDPASGRKLLVPALALAAVLGLGSVTLAVTRMLSAPDDALACLPQSMTMVGQLSVSDAIEQLGLAGKIGENDAKLKEMGIDLARDIHNVYFGADPQKVDGQGDGVLFLIEGDFDLTRLTGSLENEAGIEVETRMHNGVPFWIAPDGSGSEVAFALLRTDLVVVGRPGMLEQAIDTAIGGAPSIYANGDLRDLVEEGRGKLIWVAFEIDESTRSAMPQAKAMRSVLVSLDYDGSALSLACAASFADGAAAQEAQAAIEGGLEQLRSGDAGLPLDVNSLLLGNTVIVDGNQLEVEVRFDAERVKQAAEEAGA